MKKRILGIALCAAVLAASSLIGCSAGGGSETTAAASSEATTAAAADSAAETTKAEAETTAADKAEAGGTHNIGITIQSLENDYWAGVFGEVEKMLKDKGWKYTIVDCKDNSATQISQIENFINAGCDIIMVHPSDPFAIEDVCKQAMDAGIKVMCWDDKMENTTLNWVLDNTELGIMVATPAAEFINKHYSEDKKAEVCVIGYPQTPILLERENGILEGLKAAEGKYEVVAQIEGLEANGAQTNVETVLQAHPDCKVFVTIGAGSDIGANQALLTKYNGNIPEDCGIFSADATEQQLKAIKKGTEASRASVGFEGSNARTAKACVEMYEKALSGEELTGDARNIFRPFVIIDINNVDEYLKDYQ
ncbi:MAG: sugar ABC transporter substrate-binding protein [Johnsonella sp.]|nr:sugar ABC transporter substrate-binding protein [Johnsonella sp.]